MGMTGKFTFKPHYGSQPDWPGRHSPSVAQVFLVASVGMSQECGFLSVIAAWPDSLSLSFFFTQES